jgi:hypothetical protein
MEASRSTLKRFHRKRIVSEWCIARKKHLRVTQTFFKWRAEVLQMFMLAYQLFFGNDAHSGLAQRSILGSGALALHVSRGPHPLILIWCTRAFPWHRVKAMPIVLVNPRTFDRVYTFLEFTGFRKRLGIPILGRHIADR